MYQIKAKCPLCGGEIQETSKAYGCKNWKKTDGGCPMTIWKTSFGHDITPEEAEKLISGEDIGPFDLKFKSGKTAKAGIYFDKAEKRCRVRFPERDGGFDD